VCIEAKSFQHQHFYCCGQWHPRKHIGLNNQADLAGDTAICWPKYPAMPHLSKAATIAASMEHAISEMLNPDQGPASSTSLRSLLRGEQHGSLLLLFGSSAFLPYFSSRTFTRLHYSNRSITHLNLTLHLRLSQWPYLDTYHTPAFTFLFYCTLCISHSMHNPNLHSNLDFKLNLHNSPVTGSPFSSIHHALTPSILATQSSHQNIFISGSICGAYASVAACRRM